MSLIEKFKAGLKRTRQLTVDKISGLFNLNNLDEDALELLEEALIEADIGVKVTENLIEKLRAVHKEAKNNSIYIPRDFLKHELIELLKNGNTKPDRFKEVPWVILLAGVNGSGKTTTAGKIAHYFALQGKKSVIAASDTYRAAAIEQVEIWANRSHARLVRGSEGGDPGAVAYDAYKSALARKEDILIVDTAGRLQTHRNLMEELSKVRRVLTRINPAAPHEVLLVIDSTTGQNGLSQAHGFTEAAGVSGIIITKLDGTARGGIVIPITQELGLPIEFIGLGESIDDLHPFEAEAYVNALLEA